MDVISTRPGRPPGGAGEQLATGLLAALAEGSADGPRALLRAAAEGTASEAGAFLELPAPPAGWEPESVVLVARCGDEIEVGLYLQGDQLREVRFRGRGCSVCIASSSMMTEAVKGRDAVAARQMCDHMHGWFGQSDGDALAPPPSDLQALSAVREYPARRRCVLLSWEALADALDAI